MSNSLARLLVTGANGQLGRLVVGRLLELVPASQIVATVRTAEHGVEFASRGVEVRLADYARPESLDEAYAGVGRVLLISSNDLGGRSAHHKNVIAAASRAGVGQILYTSVLHADRTPLGLAGDHRETEAMLASSGTPFVVLRNGWYTENYAGSIPSALAHGALLGCAGEGRIASASREDYADAAAAALATGEDWSGRVLELAGDAAYTLTQFAAEIARQSGRPVVYNDLPQAEYRAALVGAGLPPPIADLLSDSDAGVAKGALFDEGRQLSAIIGRPTTSMSQTVALALAKLA